MHANLLTIFLQHSTLCNLHRRRNVDAPQWTTMWIIWAAFLCCSWTRKGQTFPRGVGLQSALPGLHVRCHNTSQHRQRGPVHQPCSVPLVCALVLCLQPWPQPTWCCNTSWPCCSGLSFSKRQDHGTPAAAVGCGENGTLPQLFAVALVIIVGCWYSCQEQALCIQAGQVLLHDQGAHCGVRGFRAADAVLQHWCAVAAPGVDGDCAELFAATFLGGRCARQVVAAQWYSLWSCKSPNWRNCACVFCNTGSAWDEMCKQQQQQQQQ